MDYQASQKLIRLIFSLLFIVGLVHCKSRTDQGEVSSYGGSDSDLPFVVPVMSDDGLCSGTVVGPNAVLTAVHCLGDLDSGGVSVLGVPSKRVIVTGVPAELEPEKYPEIVLSQDDFNALRDRSSFQNLGYEEYIKLRSKDIALLVFDVNLDREAAQIRTLSPETLEDMGLFMAGYGANEIVRVKNPNTGESEKSFEGSGIQRRAPTRVAKNEDGSPDLTRNYFQIERSSAGNLGLALPGDSGGGVYSMFDNRASVYGVFSFVDLNMSEIKGFASFVDGKNFLVHLEGQPYFRIAIQASECADEYVCPFIGNFERELTGIFKSFIGDPRSVETAWNSEDEDWKSGGFKLEEVRDALLGYLVEKNKIDPPYKHLTLWDFKASSDGRSFSMNWVGTFGKNASEDEKFLQTYYKNRSWSRARGSVHYSLDTGEIYTSRD